jgi:hypothetical protein
MKERSGLRKQYRRFAAGAGNCAGRQHQNSADTTFKTDFKPLQAVIRFYSSGISYNIKQVSQETR